MKAMPGAAVGVTGRSGVVNAAHSTSQRVPCPHLDWGSCQCALDAVLHTPLQLGTYVMWHPVAVVPHRCRSIIAFPRSFTLAHPPNSQIVTKFHYSRILKPEKLTHHTTIEVIWTIIPTLIVLLIAIPSLTLIYSLDQHTERPGEDRDGVELGPFHFR